MRGRMQRSRRVLGPRRCRLTFWSQQRAPPYDFAFQPVGLRRGDENSLIGDGPPKGARRRARSSLRATRAASGADLSQPNVGELSLKLRAEARVFFLESLARACVLQKRSFWLKTAHAAARSGGTAWAPGALRWGCRVHTHRAHCRRESHHKNNNQIQTRIKSTRVTQVPRQTSYG